MKNKEQFALITGATSGIGLELAKIFAINGYNMVIVARTENELRATAELLENKGAPKVIPVPADLFEPNAAADLYDMVAAMDIKVDILVNNAGQGAYGKFVENDLNDELKIIQLNVSSLVVLTKLYLKDMVSRGSGKILNVSSIAGKTPGPWQAVYHGTKAFVHSFNEAVNYEIKDTGVTLTSLLPGATATDFFNKADMESAKVVAEGDLADAKQVAKDGYEALMDGKDMVVSGLKNKLNVALGNVTPDSKQAAIMNEQQKPVQ